nr:26s proteasome SU A6 [Cryptomonas curvata]
MFRNPFDSEVILYSPEGRLLQIEYAKSASNRGNPIISFKSNSHLVIISVGQQIDSIRKPVNKIYAFNQNVLMGISGITGDGKLVFDLIKNKINQYEMGNSINMPISNLAIMCSNLFHTNTLYSGTRPFGVDILIGGYDKNNLNLYEISQTGYFNIELETAIGMESDINKKLIKQINQDIQFFSIYELFYHTTQFMFKIQNQSVQKLNLKKEYSIFLVGKKSKFTFFNSKVSKFFTKSYLKIENLNN